MEMTMNPMAFKIDQILTVLTVFEYVTEIFGLLIQNVHCLVCAIFCQEHLSPHSFVFQGMSHLPSWIMVRPYAMLCICVHWIRTSLCPGVRRTTFLQKAVINIAAWAHSQEGLSKVSCLDFIEWHKDFPVGIGTTFTKCSSAQSMHLTKSWTQRSSDTSHVQDQEWNSRQWLHLHVPQTKNQQGITMDLVLNLMSARYCISNHPRGCWSDGIHTT